MGKLIDLEGYFLAERCEVKFVFLAFDKKQYSKYDWTEYTIYFLSTEEIKSLVDCLSSLVLQGEPLHVTAARNTYAGLKGICR